VTEIYDELSPRAKEILDSLVAFGAMPSRNSPWMDVAELHDRMSAEAAWQKTLKASDPRHKSMLEVTCVDGANWLCIYWGGYEYSYDLNRIRRPEDLLWLIAHLGEKGWEHLTAKRIVRLIQKVAYFKGWHPFQRVPHENEAPPAFHDAKAEREKLTPALRYSVIRRDGSRCRCCGASVTTGAILHVDHIIPIAKGGLTVVGNLQTLCAVCNQGKAAS
jgi:hypothetical protein